MRNTVRGQDSHREPVIERKFLTVESSWSACVCLELIAGLAPVNRTDELSAWKI